VFVYYVVHYQVFSLSGNNSFLEDLSFTPDVPFFFFFSTRNLRDVLADWREILHGGQY